jgi:predicted MFS family arabinose efflux permease
MTDQHLRPAPSRKLVVVMSLACGVGVATLYFPQPITPLLARDLHVSVGTAAGVATAAQLGYAVGLFLIVPLGDRLPRRTLVSTLFALVTIGLFVAGAISSMTGLLVLSGLIGAVTVVPQILIPLAGDLADGSNAGRLVGALQGGLLGGILLSRAFGGLVGQWLGWRAPYLITGAITLVLTGALFAVLPRLQNSSQHSYPALLATSVRLFTGQPDLRRSCFYQFLMFGSFTAAWTSIALFLTGPKYGYGTGVVGLVALVGAASVFLVPLAGRTVDRLGPDAVSPWCFLLVAAAGALLLTGSLGGAAGLAGLVAGMLLLDVGMQSSQVANQARIFALVPGARSRLNSVYMTSAFLGGTAGSWLGARAEIDLGWWAVCVLIAVAALLALARHLVHLRARKGVVVA